MYHVSSRRYVAFRYFPLLIPLSFSGKEAAHVQGFAKECAVVTHHRLRASVDQKVMQLMHILGLSPFFRNRPRSGAASLEVPACAITLAHLALTHHTGAARGAAN